MKLNAGDAFPDVDLPDQTGRDRRLSEVAAGNPTRRAVLTRLVVFQEQRHVREMTALKDELEVAYSRMVVVSVDAPDVRSALRAGGVP